MIFLVNRRGEGGGGGGGEGERGGTRITRREYAMSNRTAKFQLISDISK